MTTKVKDQVIDNFLHKLANQLANANDVEECEKVLNNARIWLDTNFSINL